MDLVKMLQKEERAVEKQVQQLSARLEAVRKALAALSGKAKKPKKHWSQIPANKAKLRRVQRAALRARQQKIRARAK